MNSQSRTTALDSPPSTLNPPSSILNSLSPIPWAVFLAASWTWCIGMFLPVLLVRDYGIRGFLIFAIPNMIGAAAMGAVLRDREARRRIVRAHGGACVAFSTVTLLFHAFFVAWVVNGLIGAPGLWITLLLAIAMFGLAAGDAAARRLAACALVMSLIAFAVALSISRNLAAGPRQCSLEASERSDRALRRLRLRFCALPVSRSHLPPRSSIERGSRGVRRVRRWISPPVSADDSLHALVCPAPYARPMDADSERDRVDHRDPHDGAGRADCGIACPRDYFSSPIVGGTSEPHHRRNRRRRAGRGTGGVAVRRAWAGGGGKRLSPVHVFLFIAFSGIRLDLHDTAARSGAQRFHPGGWSPLPSLSQWQRRSAGWRCSTEK